MPGKIARLLFLNLVFIGQCLKVQHFRDQPLEQKQKSEHREMKEWVPNCTGRNTSVQKFEEADLSSDYCGCNGSSCFINAKKVEAKFNNQLILILGCSLDIYAIGYFCNAAAGISVEQVLYHSPLSYLSFCVVGQFTVVYAFHPGASPPPYATDYNPGLMGTTRDIVSRTKQDVKAKFGKEPTAIIVDASLWDVANWWQKTGWPGYPYPIPHPYLQQWCDKDVPELLTYVATIYPNVPIAFRTAPTVFANPNSFGLSPIVVENMVSCVEQHKDSWNRVYGGFGLIDYHHFVDLTLQNAAAPSAFYKDSLHPGPLLSLRYMNSVLNWVSERSR